MKPTWSKEGIDLYLGDCLEVLPHVKADCVVTDAPYGIADAPFRIGYRKGKRRGGDNTWHPPSTWDKEIKPEWCVAACATAPVVAWFGHWRKRGEVEVAMTWPIRAEIVWAKNCHAGPPCPLAMRDERIWLFSEKGIKGQHFETTVWDEPIIPTWNHRKHKNEKPLALMERLIRWLAPPDATICDPFMGSGTTIEAAIRLGRKAIGIELDPHYFWDICVPRVERALAERRAQLPFEETTL